MSRNFDLLRRAGKAEELFDQPTAPASVADDAPVPLNKETFRFQAVKAEKAEPLPPAGDIGKIAQKELTKLVGRLFVYPSSHAPRLVSFSSVEGSGSSEICCQIAEALAAQGSASVCLVDANLHAPSLHHLFGVDKSPGLMDTLVKPGRIKDCAMHLGRENLWLVPPGHTGAETLGLVAADQLRSRIKELKEEFDFVLIDAPPVNVGTDAIMLGQMTDGVILVLEANSTRRETARTAKETLEGANVKLLGAILNNRTFPIPDVLYRKL